MQGTAEPPDGPESTGERDSHLWAESPQPSDAEPDTGSSRAPDLPTRVCPKCSAQSQSAGEYCPFCGASYTRGRRKPSRRTKTIGLAVLLVLLLGGAAAGYAAKHHHDQQVAEKHRQERAAAHALALQKAKEAAAAREEARAKRLQRQLERSVRHSVVRSLQRSITKDARKDVEDGLLDGPILRTTCTPVGGGNVDDLQAHTGNFSCLAVYKDNADGTSSGWAFSGTVNYDDGSYTWHLGH
jgi:hypothetical protein